MISWPWKTGISGFAGSLLSKHLLDKGLRVYGLIRRKADGTEQNSGRWIEAWRVDYYLDAGNRL